jgi:hypothetical protein
VVVGPDGDSSVPLGARTAVEVFRIAVRVGRALRGDDDRLELGILERLRDVDANKPNRQPSQGRCPGERRAGGDTPAPAPSMLLRAAPASPD